MYLKMKKVKLKPVSHQTLPGLPMNIISDKNDFIKFFFLEFLKI